MWLAAALALGQPSAGTAEQQVEHLAQAAGAPEAAAANDVEPADPDAEEGAPPREPAGIEVIHVRGRAGSAIEAEVPASITQFDASTIQALGVQNIADLSRVTPNVNIVQPGATQATFFVRGVGLNDFSSNAAGAVTIFQDRVSLNAPAIQTGSLFDLENVEIVRGPQGTGPFRNASAGAILVRSRRPNGDITAQLRSSLGRYDTHGNKGAVDGALFQDYEGALEFPIAAPALSTRLAFRLREADPYKRNGCGNKIPFSQRKFRIGPGAPPGAVSVDQAAICGERDIDRGGTIPPGKQSQIPFGLPGKVGDQHSWAARGMVRVQPQEELDLVLSGHGSRLDQHSALGQAIGMGDSPGGLGQFYGGRTTSTYQEPDQAQELAELCGGFSFVGACNNPDAGSDLARNLAWRRPLDRKPYRGDYNRVGQETRDSWGAFASGEWALAGLDLSGLASYDAYRRSRNQDTDFTPDLAFEQVEEDEAWQSYEELTLGGELEREPVIWELGGFYLHERLRDEADTDLRGGSAFDRDYSQVIHSFGAWGKFEWDFLDDFTLAGGVRYNWEKKDFSYTAQQTVFGSRFPPRHAEQSTTWRTPTGELILTYHIGEDAATYARYTRGFKAGHYNAIASENVESPPADAEYNDAWEVGLSGSWLGRLISARSAFFYYRYENYQVFLFRDRVSAPPALEIVNAKQAEDYGVELEAQLRPLRGWVPRLIEGLFVSGTFGWLHGEYLDFQSELEQAGARQVLRIPIDYSGKALQSSPEFKVSATAEWTLDLGRFGALVPRYDINWSDDVFFDASEGRGLTPIKNPSATVPEFVIGQKALLLQNIRLAYRTPTGNVEFAGFVRNLTDEVYKNFAFDAATLSGIVINFPGEPRTIGVEVTFVF